MSQFAQIFGERLMLGVESSYGVLPGTPKAGKVPVMQPSIKLNVNRFTSAALSGSREPRAVTNGKQMVSGSYDVECSKDALMYPLWGTFGQVVETGIAGWYTHVFTLSPTDIPSFFFEQGHTDIAQYVLWLGVKHSSAAFKVEKEGLGQATFNVVGSSQSIGSSSNVSGGNIRDDTGALPFDYTRASLKYGGATIAYLDNLNFTIDAGVEGVSAIDGTHNLIDALGKVATIKGTFQALFKDASIITDAVNSTETSLEILLPDTTTLGHGVRIVMPTLLLQPSSPTGAVGSVIPVDFNFDSYARGSASNIKARAQSKGFATVTTAGETLGITIDGGSIVNKTLTAGTYTPAQLVTLISTVTGATVFVENSTVVIQSLTSGSTSKVNISNTGGTLVGYPTGDILGLDAKSIVVTLTNAVQNVVQP